MKFSKSLRFLATCLLAFGLLLHFTIADRSGYLRAIFYALPGPVLTAGWLFTAFWWGPSRFMGSACLSVALAFGFWWCSTSYRNGSPAEPGSAPKLKVLCWNMAHEKLPSPNLQSLLDNHKPDIVGLVEVGARHSDPDPLLTTLPPGYTARKLNHAMALVARGTIRLQHSISLNGFSKFASLEAEIDGATWRIFIVDGTSHPLRSREEVLTRVLSEARAHPRTIILGDFNTPVESALFAPWRTELLHAYTEAGEGFRETWPRHLPVLTIDHVWSSRDAPPLRASKYWLKSSDHAALLVELSKR